MESSNEDLKEQIRVLNVHIERLYKLVECTSQAGVDNGDVILQMFDDSLKRDQDLQRWVNGLREQCAVTAHAHNNHVLRSPHTEQRAGWARRRVQDAKTWAKPKGWRL